MSRLTNLLSIFAVSLTAACAPNESTTNQLITCTIDENSGVILRCQPGGEGGDNTCQDIDEDGDGMPGDDTSGEDTGSGSDSGTLSFTGGDGDDGDDGDDGQCGCDTDGDGTEDWEDDDDDNDGITDDDDCDKHDGQDDESDLPYNFDMTRGQTVTPIVDAFAEKGGQPAAILSVEMQDGGGGWRLAELQSGATFTVGDADCAHQGNKDVGKDRVVVTWRNPDGTTDSDHMTLRYCTN